MLSLYSNYCGSCNCPINSELNGTNTNFEFYVNNSFISVVEFSAAVDYIYGISSSESFEKLEGSRNDSSLKFCASCGKLLELCYVAHKNFDSTINPHSVLQELKNKSEKEFDGKDKQLHSINTISEKKEEPLEDPFLDLSYPNNDEDNEDGGDEPNEQIDIKYDPLDSAVETPDSECIDDIKYRLRNRKVVIKLERLSEENIAASNLNDGPLRWKSERTRKCSFSKVNKAVKGRLRKKTVKKSGENAKKSGNQWKCPTCYEVFTDYKYYKYKHLPVHTYGGPGLLCHLCGKRFNNRYYLKYHYLFMHASETEKLKKKKECPICGKLIFSLNMKTHMHKHGPKTPHKCDLCDKKYTVLWQLKDHVIKVHTDSSFPCDVCGKQLSSQVSLQVHIRNHHLPKRFACDQCPMTYSQNCNLRRHKDRAHTDERPLVCEECGKTFKYSSQFARHKRIHREIAENGAGSVQCDECGKYFKHSESLHKHKGRIHRENSKGTIYKCSFCGKVLSSGTTLRKHEALHRKDSNYKPRKYREGQRMPSMANEQSVCTTENTNNE